ncbi:MAG: AAA family ATPase, partial [Clostridia bacterium]|nr:AAA family ATPase [Clostridia bacterium]
MNFKISLAGDLGSGKSTVADILKTKYDAEIVSAGGIQRRLAESLGLSIKDFNVFMEKDPSYDKKLDDMLAAYDEKQGAYIFDSRMAWYFVPSAISFYLKAEPAVAAKRVFLAQRAHESFL